MLYVINFAILATMSTITIPRKEYKRLKQYSAAYLRIVEEITKAEKEYPYDYKYIDHLARGAKREKWVEARSVDEALVKAQKRR